MNEQKSVKKIEEQSRNCAELSLLTGQVCDLVKCMTWLITEKKKKNFFKENQQTKEKFDTAYQDFLNNFVTFIGNSYRIYEDISGLTL